MKDRFFSVLFILGMIFSFSTHASLINGSFETPRFTPGVADWALYDDRTTPGLGWQTTATDHKIELWSDNFQGVAAYEGEQFAELNANQASTLFQDVTGIQSGSLIDFHFAHRGRLGIDTMQLDIIDFGADNIFGTADDSTLFSKQYSDDKTAWGFYSSVNESPITALGNTLRFAYISIAAAGGNNAVGNFIDAADFGIGVNQPAAIPVPGAIWLFGCGLAWLLGFNRKQAKVLST